MLLQAVEKYVTASASRSDLDRTSAGKDKKKTGTDTGAVAVHPLSGEKVRCCRLLRSIFLRPMIAALVLGLVLACFVVLPLVAVYLV